MKEYYLAEADLTEAMKLAPKSFAYSTYAERGAFYGRLGRDELALADFTAGRKLDPKNGVFDYREALMYEARGDYKRAVGKFTEAIRFEPKRRQYYTARGSAYNNAEMYSEARDDYSHALTIVEKYTSARETAAANYGRGYAELHLGLYQQALDDFDVVLKVTPRLSNMLTWQAAAYEGLGDTERAIAAYKAALEIDPKQERALDKLRVLQPAQ